VDSRLRASFNAAYSPAVYDALKRAMAAGCETPEFPFRIAETPVFFSNDLRDRCFRAATEIVAQMSAPETIARCAERIPADFRVPDTDALPHMAVIDFAIVRDERGDLAPRLIECQGFPSLYAMQVVMGDAWGEILSGLPGMPDSWSIYGAGAGGARLDRDAYLALLRRTVVADCDPDEVVLLDIDPVSQKTRPDFVATRRLLGVREVCITRLVKRGTRLFAPRGAEGASMRRPGDAAPAERDLAPVSRVYNRIVFDELVTRAIAPPFDYREPLDVTWVPHPNWYWIWSKATIPLLRHPAVPRAWFVSDLGGVPPRLSEYVLKPLFSFAGRGVIVDVDAAALEAIPRAARRDWLLMEKVDYAPDLIAPDGAGVKVELRILCLRPDGAPSLVPAIELCRLSRGKMHGVDFNKGLDWVGSSVAIWPA
jgi:hypothetical protein